MLALVDTVIVLLVLTGLVLNSAIVFIVKVGNSYINSIEILQLIKTGLVITGLLLIFWTDMTECSYIETHAQILCTEMKGVIEELFLYSCAWTFLAVGIVRLMVCKCKGQASTLVTKRFSLATLALCLIPTGLSTVVRISWMFSSFHRTDLSPLSPLLENSYFSLFHLLLIVAPPIVIGCFTYFFVFRAISWTVRMSEGGDEELVTRRQEENLRRHSKKIVATVIILLFTTGFSWAFLIVVEGISLAVDVSDVVKTFCKGIVFVLHPIGEGLFQESKRQRFREVCRCLLVRRRKRTAPHPIIYETSIRPEGRRTESGVENASNVMSMVPEETSIVKISCLNDTQSNTQSTDTNAETCFIPSTHPFDDKPRFTEKQTFLTKVVVHSRTLRKKSTNKFRNGEEKCSPRVHFETSMERHPNIYIIQNNNISTGEQRNDGEFMETGLPSSDVRRFSFPSSNPLCTRMKTAAIQRQLKKISAPAALHSCPPMGAKRRNALCREDIPKQTEDHAETQNVALGTEDSRPKTQAKLPYSKEKTSESLVKQQVTHRQGKKKNDAMSDFEGEGLRFAARSCRRGTYGKVEGLMRRQNSRSSTSGGEMTAKPNDNYWGSRSKEERGEMTGSRRGSRMKTSRKMKVRSISCHVGVHPSKLTQPSTKMTAAEWRKSVSETHDRLLDLTSYF